MSSAGSPARARLLVVVLAGLCLVVGLLIGRRMGVAHAQPATYLQQLTDALDLRPDQVAALERVLSEEDREIDALLRQGLASIQADVAARRARTEEQLLVLLDPAQRSRYDAQVAAESGR